MGQSSNGFSRPKRLFGQPSEWAGRVAQQTGRAANSAGRASTRTKVLRSPRGADRIASMSGRGLRAFATAVAGLTVLVSAAPSVAAPAGQIEYADCYTSQADACGPGKSAIPKLSDASDVAVAPDGRQVNVTSFTDDSVTRFDRDPATGVLTRVECLTGSGTGCGVTNSGKPGIDGPAAVAVSADGRAIYLANLDSSSIVALRREPSGALTYLGCVS